MFYSSRSDAPWQLVVVQLQTRERTYCKPGNGIWHTPWQTQTFMHFQLKNLSPHNLVFPSRPKMMNPTHKLKDVFFDYTEFEIKHIPAFFCQESGKDWSHQNLLAQVISSDPRGKPFRSSPCNTKKKKILARYPKTCWQTACFWHFPGNHTCSIRNRRLSFSHLYCWCFPVVPVAHGTRIIDDNC